MFWAHALLLPSQDRVFPRRSPLRAGRSVQTPQSYAESTPRGHITVQGAGGSAVKWERVTLGDQVLGTLTFSLLFLKLFPKFEMT